jgi:hypothetical protein
MFLDSGDTVPLVKITLGRDCVGKSMAILDVPGVLDCPAERDVTPDQADVDTRSWEICAAARGESGATPPFARAHSPTCPDGVT